MNAPVPEVGWVYRENDWRSAGRIFTVKSVGGTHVTVENTATSANPGRRTRIRLDRFRSQGTRGYTRIEAT